MSSGGSERETEFGLTLPTLKVSAVARRLGIAPATLRTWSRRYGLGPSEHTAGAHRRYSPQDLARLEIVRKLTDEGVAPAEAAQIALETVFPPIQSSNFDDWVGELNFNHPLRRRSSTHPDQPSPGSPPGAVVDRLVQAMAEVNIPMWRLAMQGIFADGVRAGWETLAAIVGDWGEHLPDLVDPWAIPLVVHDLVAEMHRSVASVASPPRVLVLTPPSGVLGGQLLCGAVLEGGISATVAHPAVGAVGAVLGAVDPDVVAVVSTSSSGLDLDASRMMHEAAALSARAASNHVDDLSDGRVVIAAGSGWLDVHIRGDVERQPSRDEVLRRITHVCA